jgi:hypothetical protein
MLTHSALCWIDTTELIQRAPQYLKSISNDGYTETIQLNSPVFEVSILS